MLQTTTNARLAGMLLVLLSAMLASSSLAREPLDETRLLGAPGPATQSRNSPITVQWQDVPVREALERLAQSQRLSVWVDRRIDPTQRITLSARRTPLGEFFNLATEQAEAKAIAVGGFYYVGPPSSVEEIRTLLARGYEQTNQLAYAPRNAMLRRRSFEIARLATPRDRIEQIGSQANVSITGTTQVPHDLWQANKMPSLPLAEQLTLLLVGFDLTWQAADNGSSIEIVPIELPVTVHHPYDNQHIEQLASEVREQLTITPGDDRQHVWVAASVELHEQLLGKANQPREQAPQQPRGSKQVYTLRVAQQPVGKIVQALARQLGKQLEVDPAVTDDMLAKRVSFEVDQADLDELLTAACQPAGLQAELAGDTIRLSAAAN
ncbi:hypothetical protein [Aeoliella mucimassa]|uniref:Uncharacterized protein n=1 Tax=Aeoliella mucimassa TaxID=2527972 RepID=A0A518AM20_9BACT|nr:hypothetical protein [Aeoliella mucimassa]QDU55771.1 hypothetical protein Pan181_19660 [Aeoliella mucimassa]